MKKNISLLAVLVLSIIVTSCSKLLSELFSYKYEEDKIQIADNCLVFDCGDSVSYVSYRMKKDFRIIEQPFCNVLINSTLDTMIVYGNFYENKSHDDDPPAKDYSIVAAVLMLPDIKWHEHTTTRLAPEHVCIWVQQEDCIETITIGFISGNYTIDTIGVDKKIYTDPTCSMWYEGGYKCAASFLLRGSIPMWTNGEITSTLPLTLWLHMRIVWPATVDCCFSMEQEFSRLIEIGGDQLFDYPYLFTYGY